VYVWTKGHISDFDISNIGILLSSKQCVLKCIFLLDFNTLCFKFLYLFLNICLHMYLCFIFVYF
jgi:hypothetical protein